MHITDFNFCPSKRLIAFYVTLLLASLAILLLLPITWMVKVFGAISLALYGVYTLWRYGLLKSSKSILCMEYHGQGSWMVYTPQRHFNASIKRDSTVTPFISVIRLQEQGKRLPLSLLVCPDSLPPSIYRQWTVLLRLGA